MTKHTCLFFGWPQCLAFISILKVKDIFRTLSNIYDGALLWKSELLKTVYYVSKKFHHRCLVVLIRLWKDLLISTQPFSTLQNTTCFQIFGSFSVESSIWLFYLDVTVFMRQETGIKKIPLAAIKSRKFYQKRNNKKVDSIETGRTVVACLLPWSDYES